jgi:hypothetical protein
VGNPNAGYHTPQVKMYLKRILLLVWLLSCTLGFVMPTLAIGTGQELPLLRTDWDQSQSATFDYDI